MQKTAPEILELRNRIEKSVGRIINSPSEFEFLTGAIWERTKERISATTLKRMWGYIEGADTTRESTLRILSNFLGYETFADFLKSLENEDAFQSGLLAKEGISVDNLKVGDVVEVQWRPNRKCNFLYKGNNNFVVTVSENSKLNVGDTFDCAFFLLNTPLYIDNLVQNGHSPVAFVAGKKDGLTSASVIHSK